MSKECQVRYCNEKQSWRLYDEKDNPIDGKCYNTKEEAIQAGRQFCEETGEELCVFDKDGSLVSKRRISQRAGE